MLLRSYTDNTEWRTAYLFTEGACLGEFPSLVSCCLFDGRSHFFPINALFEGKSFLEALSSGPLTVGSTHMHPTHLLCKNKTLRHPRLIESLARQQFQLLLTTLDFSSILHPQTQSSWFRTWLWLLTVYFYISHVITMYSYWRRGRGLQTIYL